MCIGIFRYHNACFVVCCSLAAGCALYMQLVALCRRAHSNTSITVHVKNGLGTGHAILGAYIHLYTPWAVVAYKIVLYYLVRWFPFYTVLAFAVKIERIELLAAVVVVVAFAKQYLRALYSCSCVIFDAATDNTSCLYKAVGLL